MPGVAGVTTVPSRPVVETADVGLRPAAWVAPAEPAAPVLVGGVDKAERDAVQQRRRGGGQHLAERCLACQQEVDAVSLVVERAANPLLRVVIPPVGGGLRGTPLSSVSWTAM